VVRRAARRQVKRHRSPIHNLLHTTGVNPHEFETIAPIRRIPSYRPAIECIISDDKEVALQAAEKNHTKCKYKIYCDGSGFKNEIGASALLYTGNQLTKTLHFHLGSEDKHTVYEAESVGLLMGIHLLKGLNVQMRRSVALGSDSQALNRALSNQNSHPGQYLIDEIHNSAEQLHSHQDSLFNADEKRAARRAGKTWKGRTHNVINLQLHWIPSHSDFEPNERADEEAKLASQGKSSDAKLLPKILRKPLPVSMSAARQSSDKLLLKRWKRRWKSSPRYDAMRRIDDSLPSNKFLQHARNLTRKQTSLLVQLRTGHIGLNAHLFRIRRAESPSCPHCGSITVETVRHFLLLCPKYARERHILRRQLRRNADSVSFLLSKPAAFKPLMKFINSTGRLATTFGDVTNSK
jgi:ribonuclease HI